MDEHIADIWAKATKAFESGNFALAADLCQQGRSEAATERQVAVRLLGLQVRALARLGNRESADQLLPEVQREFHSPNLPPELCAELLDAEGQVHQTFGRYRECLRAYGAALDLARASDLGAQLRFGLLGRYAAALHYSDTPSAAEALFREALSLLDTTEGLRPGDVVNLWNNFGFHQAKRGRFSDAAASLEQALATARNLAGQHHPRTLHIAVNVALLYLDAGQYQRAEHLLAEVLDQQRTQQRPPTELATTLRAYGRCQAQLGRPQQALPLLEEALRAYSYADLTAEPRIHAALSLARVLLDLGRPGEAATLLTPYRDVTAPGASAASGIGGSILHADLLELLSECAQARGELAAALELQRQVQSCRDQAQGPGAIASVESQARLAALLAANRQPEHAVALLSQALEHFARLRPAVFHTAAEAERRQFLERFEHSYDLLGHAFLALSAPARQHSLRAVWQRLMQRKGLLLRVLLEQHRFRTLGEDAAARRTLDRLFDLRSQLNQRLAEVQSRQPEPPDLTALREQITSAERELARLTFPQSADLHGADLHGADLPEAPSSTAHEFERLLAALPAGACFVDVYRLEPLPDLPDADRASYLVFIAAQGQVNALRLKAAPIDNGVVLLRDTIRQYLEYPEPAERQRALTEFHQYSAAVSRLVLQPIRSAGCAGQNWLVCPDGHLSLFPWGLLHGVKSAYFEDECAVEFLNHPTDLLRQGSTSGETGPPVILANPDFGQSATAPDEPQGWWASLKKRMGLRGDGLPVAQPHFPPLTYTQQEAASIRDILTEAGTSEPVLLSGAEASLARLSEHPHPSVLHFATHSFFWGEVFPDVEHPPAPGGERELSGLALAGANQDSQGIISHTEVGQLALEGTELVVLSACETALGEMQRGEGMRSLCRAFRLAGARQVVSSLWKVPDRETRWLMEALYRELAVGSPAGQALLRARREVRERIAASGEPAHPALWGAFTVQ